jgi:hypothetical protein
VHIFFPSNKVQVYFKFGSTEKNTKFLRNMVEVILYQLKFKKKKYCSTFNTYVTFILNKLKDNNLQILNQLKEKKRPKR